MSGRWRDAGLLLVGTLVLLVLSLLPVHAQEQPPELEAIYKRGLQLYQAGKFADAIPVAEEYIAVAAAEFGEQHPLYASGIGGLGVIYQALDQPGEAEPLLKRALSIKEKALGPDHTEVADALHDLAQFYRKYGRLVEAEPLYQRALSIAERELGPEHPSIGIVLGNLAELYGAQGRHAEAKPLAQRATAIREKITAGNQPKVSPWRDESERTAPEATDRLWLETWNKQVLELYAAGKYAEATPIAQRALALAEQKLSPDDPFVSSLLNNLAMLYERQGSYADAEALLKRVLALREKRVGPRHPDVALAQNNLALVHQQQGHYAEAEQLHQRALATREQMLPVGHPDIGNSLDNLATLYQSMSRYSEAEQLYNRALVIRKKALGENHPDVGTTLNNIAELCAAQGRYADAEPLYKGALAIWEKSGPSHPMVGLVMGNLASLYRAIGRHAEAELLIKRSIDIVEAAQGPDDLTLATNLNSLALLYSEQRRYAEAEPLYQRALRIREKVLGADHPDVAQSLTNLASHYSDSDQSRNAEAEPLLTRALAIREKMLGADHPDVAATLNNTAILYSRSGRSGEAEQLYKRSLAIREKVLGSDHSDVGVSLSNLAVLHFHQLHWREATHYWRQTTDLIIRRSIHTAHDVGRPLTGFVTSETERKNYEFLFLIKALFREATDAPELIVKLAREAFLLAQWAHNSEAAVSLAQMAARGTKGDTALATLVRERQDLVEEWQNCDRVRSAAVSQSPERRDRATEAANVVRLANIDTRIGEIDKRLAADFPDYAALARPVPPSLEEVQAQLLGNEALVLFLDTPQWHPTPEETFIWVVTKTEARWLRSELGTKALGKRVAALRCGLDHTLWQESESAGKCADALQAQPAEERVGSQTVRVLPFDTGRAHELYKALLGPAEDLIKRKHLLVVPSGPLTSLPFNVLVTEPPKAVLPVKLAGYRAVAWLGTRQPITVLPSVASLKALRRFAKGSHATKAYLGVGNPLLDGQQEDRTWGNFYKKQAAAARDKQQCPKMSSTKRVAQAEARPRKSFARLFRGPNADIEEVRQFTPLPETADELCEVGRRLGVPESEILLGGRATEAALKDLSDSGRLADYAILHFATHGALTGQVQGSAEPGLVLTPPPKGTSDAKALERDDGYLTASETAALKLDADWVILSACNTAGGSGESAEALSGLARAFFYAGARALLVSHWEVGSAAAVKLTTAAFAELKANPGIGRAEAFRRSMHQLVANGSLAEAHPSYWAPFVVVGEGGVANPVSSPSVTPPQVPAKKSVSRARRKAQEDWATEFWKQRN